MTESEARSKIKYRLGKARQIAGNGVDGKSFEDLEIALQVMKEIREYRELGTVEELKDLKEKNEPNKPIDKSKNPIDWHIMACPRCEKIFWNSGQFFHYEPIFCNYCGQKLDWKGGATDEG